MKRYFAMTAAVMLCLLPFTTDAKSDEAAIDSEQNIITDQIADGIQQHIDRETEKGEGYFQFASDGQDYRFKLVKIHKEYLARLSSDRHFACVDLVDEKGDVYDVDFFLDGKPGEMEVSSTALHKLNGIPYYSWEQLEDGTWKRIPMEKATPETLGVKSKDDTFDFLYRMHIPELENTAKVWIPFPRSDEYQKIWLDRIDSPQKYELLEEKEYGNRVLYFELKPEDSGKKLDIRYRVHRKEKSAYVDESKDLERYLKPDALVPLNSNFSVIVQRVLEGKEGDLVRARALYDHTIDHMKYAKAGQGWGNGDAVYACDIKTGNCTDYHSYFIALARAAGIPAKFAIGAAIPSSRNEGGVDGYHCWAEFYAEGKWWPVDISEADKYSSLATYYFGRHPANRVEFSVGRDLVYDPAPSVGPINFHAYPLVESGGRIIKPKTQFFFQRQPSAKHTGPDPAGTR